MRMLAPSVCVCVSTCFARLGICGYKGRLFTNLKTTNLNVQLDTVNHLVAQKFGDLAQRRVNKYEGQNIYCFHITFIVFI